MGNRGQKRTEVVEDFPADKRACSSLDFRPSSSSSPMENQLESTSSRLESHETDMDTASTASASSEGEAEKGSTCGSCDSDDVDPRYGGLREYHRSRSSGDHSKFKKILSSLTDETEPSGQLAVLTELCEVLSFCTEDSLSGMLADAFSPILVKFAMHDSNPDMMLLAARAITYLCDVFPRSSAFLVRHDAVPAICHRLMAIEDLDVAEQCLQALEKISRDQPLACLEGGAIVAVLKFIDFFSTSVQRVALSVVGNICRKLPSDCPSLFMDAVPILCNLLQYEDQQLVESVAFCLTKITERVSQNPEKLDELCKHGMINQSLRLINLNSGTTLSLSVYNGIIGMLVKLSSGSYLGFRTLYELKICVILKDILATYDVPHGVSSPHLPDGHCIQVQEVLKLLYELLPTLANNQDCQHVSEKVAFLCSNPGFLRMFGMDVLPLLIQVVNSGANIHVCYGCLIIINNLLSLSTSDILAEVLTDSNFPSFLAGVFTRKDYHVLDIALQIAESSLQKLGDMCLKSFIKEGVFFAIDALITPEKCSHRLFPVFSGNQLSVDSSQKPANKGVLRCLCYAFENGHSPSASETGTCKLALDTVHQRAKDIRTSFFSPELCDSEEALTDILQMLKMFAVSINDLMNESNDESSLQHEEKFHSVVHQIAVKLNGSEPISTFEFIESGVVKSLVNYLSSGLSTCDTVELDGKVGHLFVIEKRLRVFGRLVLTPLDSLHGDVPMVVLIRKLQSALSSLENFPVIINNSTKQRNSFAMVPNGRCVSHPCLRVHFVRGEGEECLCDYSQDVITVDPFTPLNAIEGFLYPKVKKSETVEKNTLVEEENLPLKLPINANLTCGESSENMEFHGMSTALQDLQQGEANLSKSIPDQPDVGRQSNPGETSDEQDSAVSQSKTEADINNKSTQSPSSEDDIPLPKLLFYLDGQQIDRTLSLYQAVLQQQIKVGNEMIASSKLWSQVYTLTYRRAAEPRPVYSQECPFSGRNLPLLDKTGVFMQGIQFSSDLFAGKLVSDLEKPSPVYDIIVLLKSMEAMNRQAFQLMSFERMAAFAEGRMDDLDDLKVMAPLVLQNEFVSSKLTEKLEQQMRDSLAVSTGGLPSWCNQLMDSCPFLFSFEARHKYFHLSAFGQLQIQPDPPSHSSTSALSDRRRSASGLVRKKFLVHRDHIMDSAVQMMDLYARQRVALEVEFDDEVGTGLGPTLEFYTLISHEFQKPGLGMWREDHGSSSSKVMETHGSEMILSPFGHFPGPWAPALCISENLEFAEVINRFILLGKLVAKALQDGRVLDLHLSKAFYKLIIGQGLTLYDIPSFDPELGRTLLEFQALVDRKKFLESVHRESSTLKNDFCFRNITVEDLCLDFTVPGYPNYVLSSGPDHKMVNMTNLEDYVSFVVDATTNSGISRQVEAFKSGFNQVFPIKNLQIFSEDELERLLCGENNSWEFGELLEHIKFDHGYTASSTPVIYLLETIQEFDKEQQRSFLQFVTGAPRLPSGGLASLNPKLTIVRKHCSKSADAELPSVMTCANYLKLPPYSSKEKMKEKILYAIREGQGSFHLS
ncbi:E3 ubiquitin-protein ligase UPL4 [Rhodamnia argentea]|uniref:HECT-type E3 ubiquitin transferase n=1 Tax=Rhodamnia argentea TaxID=178133 RepID=A0A8B8NHL5_9MYRT|nr:E3 ubiquitin-protein ligase UPL4 [Rhodamnia argentea]XP_048142024.1 E3 ubiquitin-protein ligase UPL4 [Rhodamnia argentea]